MQDAVEERVGPHSPELSSAVRQLLDDPHALNVTNSLRSPVLHERVLAIIEELAHGDALRPHGADLVAFLADNLGHGPLFEVVDAAINSVDGQSRLARYVAELKAADPTLELGATVTPDERVALDDYADRLRDAVLPAVDRELGAIVAQVSDGPGGRAGFDYNSRPKDADGLLDKVGRMTRGRPGDDARSAYRVGDIVDAVGARITVPDMASLQRTLAAVIAHFGVGDGGRIVEVDNMYAQPKAKNPAYRVIPLVIGIEVDGHRYTFELQLTTLRASVAADIEHNSLYKPYVSLTQEEREAVLSALREAAALDQLEMSGD